MYGRELSDRVCVREFEKRRWGEELQENAEKGEVWRGKLKVGSVRRVRGMLGAVSVLVPD